MTIQRRTMLGAAAATALTATHRTRAQTRPVVKIGVMNDQSGPYRDVNGPTSVICARQAVQEFAAGDFDVEVLSADHQNKPDVAVSLAREWFDQRGVDIIIDIAATSCALALASIVKAKNKIMIACSTASSDVTGKACTPNSMHWVFDTYMEAKSTGGAMVKAGGDTWYFITPNYAFGEATQRDTTRFVEAAGGEVLGSQVYPFPETTDFSAFLVRAQASGAKILGICGAGADLINIIKQAHEFGLTQTMKLAAMVAYTTDIHSIGIELGRRHSSIGNLLLGLQRSNPRVSESHPVESDLMAQYGAGRRLLLHPTLLEDGEGYGRRTSQDRRCRDRGSHEGDSHRRRLFWAWQNP